MADFVITEDGVEIPTLEDLIARVDDELHAEIDATLDVSAESPEGQMKGIFLSHLREAYEAIQVLADISPRDAEAAWLDLVASLTGTRREGATYTTFRGARRIEVNLDAGVTLDAGAIAHVTDRPDIRVVTTEDATNAGGSPAWIEVEAQAEEIGPVVINADTITAIATPVAGWNDVRNTSDGETGRLREEDSELRARRERELRKPGGAGKDALEVEIESIVYEGSKVVQSCQIFRNTTMFLDHRGLPPKSFEALVFDGTGADCPDNVLAQVIWNNAAAGIEIYGATHSGFSIDRNGSRTVVPFSRPSIVPISIVLAYLYPVRTYVGDDAFKVEVARQLKEMARPEMLIAWSDVVDIAKNVLGGPGFGRVSNVQIVGADPFEDFQMPQRTYPLFDSSQITITPAPIG